MKKNKKYIILLLVLGVVAAYFISNNTGSTIRKELKDFAVSDTSSINKIFMADRQGKSVLLERKNSALWMVNNKYSARQDAINTLLYTIKSMEVLSPVGKNLYNHTMKLLSSNAVKVEIYSNGEIIKTFYVGHPTMDNLGTFMYLEESSVPFIMNIPGFNGYLTSRFFVDEMDWRSRNIFAFDPRTIEKASVTDFQNRDSSFTLTRLKDSSYVITTGNSVQLPSVDMFKLQTYLSSFANINYERVFTDITPNVKDSLLKVGPFKTIDIVLINGQTVNAQLFLKRFTGVSMNPEDEGVVYPFDPDRFYLSITGDQNWYECQYFQWGKLLKTPSYFIPAGGVRK